MSRPSMLPPAQASSGAPRQLSLTEELEKLEQSITLTLQEIDHNFNQCHRIVTHSIMPIIERYSEESDNVNEGSRFWKHFFEGSANVSIGTYESHPEDEETTVMTGESEQTFTQSQYAEGSSPITYNKGRSRLDHDDSSELDLDDESILASMNLTGAHPQSTPRQNKKPKGTNGQARWANMESPYETLRKEMRNGDDQYHEPYGDEEDDTSLPIPVTARKYDTTDDSTPQAPTTPESIRRPPGQHRPPARMLADDSPESSPYKPQPPLSTTKRSKHDILLHRAVDTNWRLQATPINPFRNTTSASTPGTARQIAAGEDSDSDLFSSPVPPQMTTVFSPSPKYKSAKTTAVGPKTPGSTRKERLTAPKSNTKYDFDYSDDDEDDLDMARMGFSPPVTMQFSLPPSKLMQTPAKEASKRMVRDIMQSAGLGGEYGEDSTATTMDSPSMLVANSITDDF